MSKRCNLVSQNILCVFRNCTFYSFAIDRDRFYNCMLNVNHVNNNLYVDNINMLEGIFDNFYGTYQ